MTGRQKRTALDAIADSRGLHLVVADGFDEAILGISERAGEVPAVVYDRAKAVAILMGRGLSLEEAAEHFSFNVSGAYVGEATPIWLEAIP